MTPFGPKLIRVAAAAVVGGLLVLGAGRTGADDETVSVFTFGFQQRGDHDR